LGGLHELVGVGRGDLEQTRRGGRGLDGRGDLELGRLGGSGRRGGGRRSGLGGGRRLLRGALEGGLELGDLGLLLGVLVDQTLELVLDLVEELLDIAHVVAVSQPYGRELLVANVLGRERHLVTSACESCLSVVKVCESVANGTRPSYAAATRPGAGVSTFTRRSPAPGTGG